MQRGIQAGALAPELANIIGHHAGINNNMAAKAIAHAILGGVTAALQGNSVAAGAIGASSGELAAGAIASILYPEVTDPSKLTEDQKQTVSTLASISAGIVGGIASGSTAGAATGAGAGKNAAENNTLVVPVPVPVPGVPVGPGDKVKQDADKNIASGLEGAIKDLGEALDKATQCLFGRACSSDDTEQAEGPNTGKNLTDEEKVEFGGAGSGTPGGWGPEDEEKGQNLDAPSVGKDIADGHVFEKHVIDKNEFADLGIKTKEQFAQHIENVVNIPTASRTLSCGRSAYWDDATGTVVMRNPKASDGGTAFRPTNGRAYFDNLR